MDQKVVGQHDFDLQKKIDEAGETIEQNKVIYWKIFQQEMLSHIPKISLSHRDIKERKDLICFIRNKLKNRNYTQRDHERYYGKLETQDQSSGKDFYEGHKENDEGVKQNVLNPFSKFSHGYDDYGYYDSGLDLEVFGSYAAGLSLKGSDIDVRVNDFFTYRYLNLEKMGKNLTFEDADNQPKVWARSTARLEILEHHKQAKVPVLQMRDKVTDIQFDVTQGSSAVNKRHIEICRKSQKCHLGLKALVLTLKKYLEVRECHKTFSGGISSFLLFYMVLGFYQNRSSEEFKMPDFIGFIHFYANLDEANIGLQIDLSHIFTEEYSQDTGFPTVVPVPDFVKNKPNWQGLYIKDPIGKFYYRADPTGFEMQTYRENIGASSYRYTEMVKREFQNTLQEIEQLTSFNEIITWKSHFSIEIEKESPPKEQQNYHEGEEWPADMQPTQHSTDPQQSLKKQIKSIVSLNVDEIEQIVQKKSEQYTEEKQQTDYNNQAKSVPIKSLSKGILKSKSTSQQSSQGTPKIAKKHVQVLKQKERQEKFKQILDDIENQRQKVN